MKTTLLAVTALAVGTASFLTGCQSNLESVKSSAGRDIVPMTGSAAEQAAGSVPVVTGGPALGKRSPALETVALFPGPAQPAGIAVSAQGRIFLSFPRWADPVKNTVVELRDGKLIAFPDEATNAFDATDLKNYNPAEHLISVQAIEFDGRDRLWLLDPGSFNFAPSLQNGPKLWAYDINTGPAGQGDHFPHRRRFEDVGPERRPVRSQSRHRGNRLHHRQRRRRHYRRRPGHRRFVATPRRPPVGPPNARPDRHVRRAAISPNAS